MREILFRGRRLDNGEWVEGYYMRYGWTGDIKDRIMMDGASALYAHEVDPATVGQFTGLVDKHGMKIFEGDVVRYTNHVEDIYHEEIGVCVFEQLESNFCLQRTVQNPANYPVPKTTHTVYLISNVEYEAVYEVIGNIHDNNGMLGGAE